MLSTGTAKERVESAPRRWSRIQFLATRGGARSTLFSRTIYLATQVLRLHAERVWMEGT